MTDINVLEQLFKFQKDIAEIQKELIDSLIAEKRALEQDLENTNEELARLKFEHK